MPYESPAKKQVVDFMRKTTEGQVSYTGVDYEFNIKGNKRTATKFVDNMRVHLTRLRQIALDRGAHIKPFRMKVMDIQLVEGSFGEFVVKLRRVETEEPLDRLAAEFVALGGGDKE